MKRINVLTIITLLFSMMFTTFAQEDSPKAVEKLLESGKYTIEITRISPLSMPSKTTASEYKMDFNDNNLTTRLPYMGKMDQMGMGGSRDISISIENQKVDIQTKYNEKKEKHELRFRVKDDNSKSNCDFYIEIFNNGSCMIRMNMIGRDPISYNGEISNIK